MEGLVWPEDNSDEADLGKREGECRVERDCARDNFIGGCRRAEVLVRLRGGWFSVVGDAGFEESRFFRLVRMLVTSGADDRSVLPWGMAGKGYAVEDLPGRQVL
jgi:hypothetical protein